MIGQNLQELRKASGLSQTELADDLTKAGLPFRQQTVLKVEKGQRPLKVAEVVLIADVLDVDVDTLLAESFHRDDTADLVRQTTQVAQDWTDLRAAALTLLDHLWWLQSSLERGAKSGVSQVVLNKAATYAQLDPVKVVSDVIEERKKRMDLQGAEYAAGVEWVRYEEADNG